MLKIQNFSLNMPVYQAENRKIKNYRLNNLPCDRVTFSANKKEVNKAHEVAKILPKAVDIRQEQLDKIFSDEKFAKQVLDRDWFEEWKKSGIPTTGFCYPAAEFWYFFVDSTAKPKRIDYKNAKVIDPKTGKERNETHWFLLKEPDGRQVDSRKAEYKWNGKIIYDPSRSQFKGESPGYENAINTGFMTEFPSHKACAIACRLGIISEEQAKSIPQIFRGAKNKDLTFEKKLGKLKNLFSQKN